MNNSNKLESGMDFLFDAILSLKIEECYRF